MEKRRLLRFARNDKEVNVHNDKKVNICNDKEINVCNNVVEIAP
ncbi:hypothetical protein [Thermodesulfovibrio hydrogeniphilus]